MNFLFHTGTFWVNKFFKYCGKFLVVVAFINFTQKVEIHEILKQILLGSEMSTKNFGLSRIFLLEIYITSIYYCFKEIFSYKVGLPIILNGTFFAFSKVTYEPKFNVIQFITNTWTNNSCINGLFAFWSTNRSFNPIHSIYCLLFGGGCLCMWCIAQFLIRLLTLLTSAKKPYYSMVGPTRRALCKPAIRTDW